MDKAFSAAFPFRSPLAARSGPPEPVGRLRTLRGISLVLAGSLALSSCIPPGQTFMGGGGESAYQDYNLSPQQRQLRAEASRIESQRSLITTVVGCVAGAGIGALAGGKNNRATGIIAGGLLGCGAGYAAGEYVNARARQHANDQEALRDMTRAANEEASRYASMNAAAASVVREQQAKISDLNRRYRRGQVTAEEVRSQLASASADVSSLRKLVADADANLKIVQDDVAKLRAENIRNRELASLQASRDRLRRERDGLQKQLDALVSALDTVPPEAKPSFTS